jgi:hypothetical protein
VPGIDRGLDQPSGPAAIFPPPPAVEAPPEVVSARVTSLSNGLRVLLVPRRDFPGFTAVLAFPGGRKLSDQLSDPLGAGEIVSRVLRVAHVGLPANALEVVPVDAVDYSAAIVRGGARNLPNALMLLAKYVVSADELEW